jgi:hypothetical protein
VRGFVVGIDIHQVTFQAQLLNIARVTRFVKVAHDEECLVAVGITLIVEMPYELLYLCVTNGLLCVTLRGPRPQVERTHNDVFQGQATL